MLTRRISRREAPDTMKILAAKSDLEKAEEMGTIKALGKKHGLGKAAARFSIVTLALGAIRFPRGCQFRISRQE